MSTSNGVEVKKPQFLEKTIVVTGASSGAGRAIAIELSKHGAKLVLAGRRMEALDKLEAECRENGALAIAVETDVTDAQQMKKLAITANQFGGGIDVWINNAGVLAAGEFTETPVEVHDRVIKINLMGYLHGAHAVLPYFKRQGHGILINNISVGGWFPVPYGVGYSASKFGLRGFSEALRGELIRYPDIHICDLFPAFLDTPGIQHAANYTGHILRPAPPVYDPQRVARNIVSIIQHPKQGTTIGSVASFLRLAHFFAPAISRFVTAKMVEAYLKIAPPAPKSSGNLFEPIDYGTSIHGGWNTASDANVRRKSAGRVLLVAGVAVGLMLLGKSKLSKKQFH